MRQHEIPADALNRNPRSRFDEERERLEQHGGYAISDLEANKAIDIVYIDIDKNDTEVNSKAAGGGEGRNNEDSCDRCNGQGRQ